MPPIRRIGTATMRVRPAHALLWRSILAMLARRQRRCKPDRLTT